VKDKTKSKDKVAKKHHKLVAKAMTKALKKAPKNQIKLKELRKLVRAKTEKTMGKDEIKLAVQELLAKNKDSMSLLDGGKVVKLLV